MDLRVVVISKSDKDRFIERLPQIDIVYYGNRSEHFYQFIEGPEIETDLFIIDSDFPDFPEMAKLVAGRMIPFTGDYGKAKSQIEPLIQKIEQEKGAVIEHPAPAPLFVTKERRIKETVVINKEVMRPTTISMQRKLILVGGCDRGNGSSFAVRNIAEALGGAGILVSLIELPFGQPYHFDRSLLTPGILEKMNKYEEQQFHSEFINVPLFITKGKQLVSEPYYKNGVYYMIPHPDIKVKGWSPSYSIKIVGAARNSVLTIIDVGTSWRQPAVQELFYEADEILLLQPSEPARLERLLNPNYQPSRIFNFLLKSGKPIHLVFNQYHKNPTREFLIDHFSFSAIKHHSFFPQVEREVSDLAAFTGTAEYGSSAELSAAVERIIQKWFPSVSLEDPAKDTRTTKWSGLASLKKYMPNMKKGDST